MKPITYRVPFRLDSDRARAWKNTQDSVLDLAREVARLAGEARVTVTGALPDECWRRGYRYQLAALHTGEIRIEYVPFDGWRDGDDWRKDCDFSQPLEKPYPLSLLRAAVPALGRMVEDIKAKVIERRVGSTEVSRAAQLALARLKGERE